ncbi:MAG: hypothetical protein JRN67_05940 [Nitrososphaerota archaeon]|nr:hypothetical protein [Nitrososphaerota archaeon]
MSERLEQCPACGGECKYDHADDVDVVACTKCEWFVALGSRKGAST